MTSHSLNARGSAGWLRVALWFSILAGLAVIGWLASTGGKARAVDPAAPKQPLARDDGHNGPWKTSASGGGQHASAPGDEGGTAAEQTPLVDAWMEANWKEADDAKLIDGLLAFASRPDLGVAEKSRALEHALNLLPDPDYAKLDTILADPGTPSPLLDQIFSDMHNRSERATIHAGLRLLQRPEAEMVAAAKGLLAHWLDLDEENEVEAIRLQGETRLIELSEEQPPAEDVMEVDPGAPIPEGLIDTAEPPVVE